MLNHVPKSGGAADRSTQTPREHQTLFPSRGRWEGDGQKPLNLEALRAKATNYSNIERLLEQRAEWLSARASEQANGDHAEQLSPAEATRRKKGSCNRLPTESPRTELQFDHTELTALVERLPIDADRREQLLADAMLIVTWYFDAERRPIVSFDRASRLDEMARAAKHATRLSDTLALGMFEYQHLIEAMPDALGDFDDLDIPELALHVDRFVEAVGVAKKVYGRRRGRQSDDDRNNAIILATQAVEEASHIRVEASKGTEGGLEARFLNPGGLFVSGLMKLLGWPDESILARAFIRMCRQPKLQRKQANQINL